MAVWTGQCLQVSHIREKRRDKRGPGAKTAAPHSRGFWANVERALTPLLHLAEGGDFRERTKQV